MGDEVSDGKRSSDQYQPLILLRGFIPVNSRHSRAKSAVPLTQRSHEKGRIRHPWVCFAIRRDLNSAVAVVSATHPEIGHRTLILTKTTCPYDNHDFPTMSSIASRCSWYSTGLSYGQVVFVKIKVRWPDLKG